MNFNIDRFSDKNLNSTKRKSNRPKNNIGKNDGTIFFFSRNQLSDKDKEAFFSELNLLLSSGLDFKKSIDFFIENQKNVKKVIYTGIQHDVVSGMSLSDALDNSKAFSPYDVNSIKISEETGDLTTILEEMSKFYSSKIQSKRLLMGALSYPVLVLVTSVLAVAFLLNFLVPMFSDIYKRLGQELPTITKVVVSMSKFFSNYFLFFLIFILSFSLVIYIYRKSKIVRSIGAKTILGLPIIGNVIKLIYLQRFTTSIYFLLNAKIPVVNALEIIKKMIDFYPIEKSIPEMQEMILKGNGLSIALKSSPFFPSRMIAIVNIGEESNKLPEVFRKLSAQYGEEAEFKIKSLGSLIEPVMIVFLALVVGIVLIAMYLPIFKLVNNFGI